LLPITFLSYGQKGLSPKKIHQVKPLPKIRAADVLWYRRVLREIDLTEKINQHLYFYQKNVYPNYSLYDILYYNLKNGTITAYNSKDDRFTTKLNIDQLPTKTGDFIETNNLLSFEELNSRNVTKYWIKEDSIYDSKNSIVDVRIVGICPVKIKKSKNGNVVGYQQLFWLYFPHIRKVLVNYDAYKQKDDDKTERISFDDVFISRIFDSYIIPKPNATNMNSNALPREFSIKLENEKIRRYYYDEEKELWGY